MKKESMANVLGWVIIVLGSIGSLVMGNVYKAIDFSYGNYVSYKYNWSLAISGIIGCVILGLIFIFIAEIINIGNLNYTNINVIDKSLRSIDQRLEKLEKENNQ